MFNTQDVVEAMKASKFNKGLWPDVIDVTIIKPGDEFHRLNQQITA